MEGVVKIICPEMYVRFQKLGLALTDELGAIWNLSLPNRNTVGGVICFPPTLVRSHSPVDWVVDSCVAESLPSSKDRISLTLPEEICKITFSFHEDLFMEVEEITATGEIRLVDGSVGKVSIVFPKCKARWQSLGLWLVESVDALGTAKFDIPGSI